MDIVNACGNFMEFLGMMKSTVRTWEEIDVSLFMIHV